MTLLKNVEVTSSRQIKTPALHSRNLLEGPSPFIHHKYTKITHFSFKNGLPTLISRSHFHFLHFIYFQRVFSVFSSSYDASSHFQIEAPNYIYIFSYEASGTAKEKQDMIAELNVVKRLKPHHVLKLIGCCSISGKSVIWRYGAYTSASWLWNQL